MLLEFYSALEGAYFLLRHRLQALGDYVIKANQSGQVALNSLQELFITRGGVAKWYFDQACNFVPNGEDVHDIGSCENYEQPKGVRELVMSSYYRLGRTSGITLHEGAAWQDVIAFTPEPGWACTVTAEVVASRVDDPGSMATFLLRASFYTTDQGVVGQRGPCRVLDAENGDAPGLDATIDTDVSSVRVRGLGVAGHAWRFNAKVHTFEIA